MDERSQGSIERAEQLIATWVRNGGLTYRELIMELWRLGDVERGSENPKQNLQVRGDGVDFADRLE